jgi:[acyl-carrier-protein] S-malonyltransferase
MTIAFVFPGQGSQVIGMGREFFDNFVTAQDVFAEVDEALQQNLSKLIFEGNPDELTLTENAQPALMTVSMAIVRTLEYQLGHPIHQYLKLVAGHSLGEYTAHCAAQTFSLSDTARLLKLRGQAMQQAVPLGQGAMAAILGLEIDLVEQLVQDACDYDTCVIANDNSPGQVVISGHQTAVHRAIALAGERGAKRALPLAVSAPFHSPLMQPASLVMAQALSETQKQDPLIPVLANVTTQPTQNAEESKELLVKQVTARVRWRESMAKLRDLGINQVVEVGAGKVLTGLIKRIDPEIHSIAINTPQDMDQFLKNIA